MSMFKDVVPSMMTNSAAEGRELAILIARKTVASIQPDAKIREELRSSYDSDPELLMKASHIVAIEFQTIAAANNFWKQGE